METHRQMHEFLKQPVTNILDNQLTGGLDVILLKVAPDTLDDSQPDDNHWNEVNQGSVISRDNIVDQRLDQVDVSNIRTGDNQ
jgi:hypothetical protein